MTFRQPTQAERQEQRAAQKSANLTALATIPARSLHRGTYSGATTAAVPKTEPGRNAALLTMAHGRQCLLNCVAQCRGFHGETTVACHRNEGKGMALKQSDAYTCWGCAACHEWYDRSGAPRAEKRRAFMEAHLRQVIKWREIAADPSEPARFRKAAQWALRELEATP